MIDEIQNATSEFRGMVKNAEQSIRTIRVTAATLGKIDRTLESAENILDLLNKKMDKEQKTLKDVCKLIETVEETLCNVLLAMKQHECYHAWFPTAWNPKK